MYLVINSCSSILLPSQPSLTSANDNFVHNSSCTGNGLCSRLWLLPISFHFFLKLFLIFFYLFFKIYIIFIVIQVQLSPFPPLPLVPTPVIPNSHPRSYSPFALSMCPLFVGFRERKGKRERLTDRQTETEIEGDRKRDRRREKETVICCSTYLCIHWLIPVCALMRDQTHNLGIWEWCSNQLSYLAKASSVFLFHSEYHPVSVPLPIGHK